MLFVHLLRFSYNGVRFGRNIALGMVAGFEIVPVSLDFASPERQPLFGPVIEPLAIRLILASLLIPP